MGLMICMHSHYNDIGMIANENILYHCISNVEKVKFVHCEVTSFFLAYAEKDTYAQSFRYRNTLTVYKSKA